MCGYYEGDTTCDCGVSSENTRHMLEFPLLAHSCSLDDLIQFNETAKQSNNGRQRFDDTMTKTENEKLCERVIVGTIYKLFITFL